ncbi:ComEC/Rec2 family competence protein [Shigella flexneri]
MANLMMAALIASVMPLPSISRSPAVFLQASVIEPNCSLRAQYLASLQTTLQPYPWNAVILGLGMGNGYRPQRNQNIMRDTGTAHLMAISGLHIAFAALLAAGLIRSGQNFLPGAGSTGKYH